MEDIIFHSLVGLDNLGVNCFFNCGIQIILHSYNFMIDILDDIKMNLLNNKYNKNSISSGFMELCKLIIQNYLIYNDINTDKITSVDISKNKCNYFNYPEKRNNLSICPKNFLNLFTKIHPVYKDSEEDAVEFIRVLLNDLSVENNYNNPYVEYKELTFEGKTKSKLSKEYHDNYIKKENSAIIKNYYFQMVNIYICPCGYESYSFDKYLDLPLLIPEEKKDYKLIDLIRYHLNSTVTNWIYKCENCKENNMNHYKLEKFDMISKYFIIYIQRMNKFLKTKNTSNIKFDEILNLNEFCDDELKAIGIKLKLVGIIYHNGLLESGHYYTIFKIHDKWFRFNDNRVTLINKIEFESEEACAFLYEKYN